VTEELTADKQLGDNNMLSVLM